MRYFYERPHNYIPMYGIAYQCDHPLYNFCTLYLQNDVGLAVVQERYDALSKHRWYGPLDPWLANDIYLADGFADYFHRNAKMATDGLYPTVSARKIMWALRMKPLKKAFWELQNV